MKEADYINATNRVRISIALETIKDILPDGSFILKDEHTEIIKRLERLLSRILELGR